MIDLNLFFALVSFYFVMYVTPGPNNAMVLTSGLKFGFYQNHSPYVRNYNWSYFTVNFSLSWVGKNFFKYFLKFSRY